MGRRLASPTARIALIAVLLALASVAALLLGAPMLELLRDNHAVLLDWRSANVVGLTLALILANVFVVALCLPGSFVVTVASGFLFGFLPGTMLAVISGAIGAWLVYLWVRAGFGAALLERLRQGDGDGTLARILETLQRNEVRWLILMRVIPVVPFMVANVAPALLGIGMRRFVVTTLIGIAPGTALTAWIGAGAAEALETQGRADFTGGLPPALWGIVVALCVLAALPMVVRRVKRVALKAAR